MNRYHVLSINLDIQNAMKNKFSHRLTILVLSAFFSIHLSANDSTRAAEIIRQFSDKLKSQKQFSFECYHRYVNDAVDDSVFTSSGTLWWERNPSDSIFGSRFHIKGMDKGGDFDYFYDGISAIEIRHPEQKIVTINPYLFPNNDNNPAKARTSLRALRAIWTENDVFSFLVTHYPYAAPPALKLDSTSNDWVILMDYPRNADNAKTEITLWISKTSGLLWKSRRVTAWNGSVHTEINEVKNIQFDAAFIAENLSLKSSYPGYKSTALAPRKMETERKIHPLTGQPAPAFSYMSYEGKQVSLASLKGKYVLLDFWESWCGYCILALPKIKKLYETCHEKGVEVIGVTTGNFSKMEKLIAANQLPYPNLKADEKILKNYDVSGRPNYVLIGRDGKIMVYNDWEKIESILSGLQ